jgi:hypothetical protein
MLFGSSKSKLCKDFGNLNGASKSLEDMHF